MPITVRQKEASEDRGLDQTIIDSLKITLLEGDLTVPGLGLTEDVLLELESVVTYILHIGSSRVHSVLRLIPNSLP